MPRDIASARLCACGCGKITPIAPCTRPSRGWVKGEHVEYYPHHSKNRWPVTTEAEKQCRECKEVLPLVSFAKNKANRDGLQGFCRDCSKVRSYGYRSTGQGRVRFVAIRLRSKLKKYKITEAEYDAMSQRQDWRCAICRKPETETFKGIPKRLAIDHCHTTGKVRGLLCSACNHAIGKLKDDPALLRRAIDYLEAA